MEKIDVLLKCYEVFAQTNVTHFYIPFFNHDVCTVVITEVVSSLVMLGRVVLYNDEYHVISFTV